MRQTWVLCHNWQSTQDLGLRLVHRTRLAVVRYAHIHPLLSQLTTGNFA